MVAELHLPSLEQPAAEKAGLAERAQLSTRIVSLERGGSYRFDVA